MQSWGCEDRVAELSWSHQPVSLVLWYQSVSVRFQATLLPSEEMSVSSPCLIHPWGCPGPSEIAQNITCPWSYWFSPPHLCPSGSCTSRGVVGSWSRDTCQGIPHRPRTCFPPAETGLVVWAEFRHHSFQTCPGSSTADNHKGWETEEHQSQRLNCNKGQAAAPGDGSNARGPTNLLFT